MALAKNRIKLDRANANALSMSSNTAMTGCNNKYNTSVEKK